jgi:ECF sigma factor
VDTDEAQQWNSRGHFFAAAAEAMRRILVERARHKRSLKAGGDRGRQELPDIEMAVAGAPFVPEPSRERFMQVTWRSGSVGKEGPNG